jgi:hypothetical protein
MEHTTGKQRLQLLHDVLFDEDVTRLLGLMRRAKEVQPTYLRTVAYQTLGRLGLLSSDVAETIEGEDER